MEARVRSISGAILFVFLASHLVNHAFGVISFDAMEAANTVLIFFWKTWIGFALMVWAFVAHYVIGLKAVYRRRTLKLSALEIGQLASGLIVPVLLVEHVMGTRVAEMALGMEPTYRYVIAALWVGSPISGVMQTVVLIVAWVHGCIGLHLWLRVKPWYPRWHRILVATAIIIPVLALAGFVSAGFELLSELNRDHMLAGIMQQVKYDPEGVRTLVDWITPLMLGFTLIGISPFILRVLRDHFLSRTKVLLVLPDGTRIPVPPGATALEALRGAGRPHAAVCGGRGRCTTCRVRVMQGAELLAEPEALEAEALKRIKALEGVRLACQIRPKADLGVSPLLPPTASAKEGRQLGGLEGEERRITALFIDIRGSTRLGEDKLPYDVLFILNQFFSEMSRAISETGGHYAQFNGDGLMALYGLTAAPEAGAKDALRGAAAMLRRLEALNASLESELPFPLRVGIGLHHGEAIVGAMGPPQAQITSAIGDTINIAARLESLTKDHGKPVILSQEVALAAGVGTDGLERAETPVRGRTAPVTFYPVSDPLALLA